MFRNQYDGDITIFSPEGRIHQVEYAMEAVKQGSAAVGLKSNDYVVITSLKRGSGDLSSYQKKIFRIDSHMGIAIAGLSADARVLSHYMRSECLSHRYVYDSQMQTSRLVEQIGDKSQANTQRMGRRPFGVGLLVAGYDKTGTHLFQTDPDGEFYDFKSISIGSRSQSAKTYLEKKYEEFPTATLPQLIQHGLAALKETAQQGTTLSTKNVSIGIVGKNFPFTLLDDQAVDPYVKALESGTPAAVPTPMQQ